MTSRSRSILCSALFALAGAALAATATYLLVQGRTADAYPAPTL